jgi:phosphoglycerol transferase MdoB-like AlkP superfamily enzyme
MGVSYSVKIWSFNLNIWKFKKQCQSDFDGGLSRSSIFEKYSKNEMSEKKLATIIATIKDGTLTKKYRLLNYLLAGVMILLALVISFSFYEIAKSGEMAVIAIVSVIVLLFVALIYGVIKNNYQAYLIYALLTTMKLPTHIDGFGSDLTVNIIELSIAIFLVFTTWFLKSKLFPYMTIFGGPKKNDDGKYLVALNS